MVLAVPNNSISNFIQGNGKRKCISWNLAWVYAPHPHCWLQIAQFSFCLHKLIANIRVKFGVFQVHPIPAYANTDKTAWTTMAVPISNLVCNTITEYLVSLRLQFFHSEEIQNWHKNHRTNQLLLFTNAAKRKT